MQVFAGFDIAEHVDSSTIWNHISSFNLSQYGLKTL